MNSLYDFYYSMCNKFSGCMLFDEQITYDQAFTLACERAAYLAKNLNIPLIPITIKGASAILPSGKKWPCFFKTDSLIVKAGDKIDPINFKTVKQLNSAMLKAMQDLLK
ncbi:MAG: hypothetical protein PF637_01285 [Spirochaetes bacterium]|jgi:ribosomal protein S11|nr:hypothetical protein [Spirochaetota bacterium]